MFWNIGKPKRRSRCAPRRRSRTAKTRRAPKKKERPLGKVTSPSGKSGYKVRVRYKPGTTRIESFISPGGTRSPVTVVGARYTVPNRSGGRMFVSPGTRGARKDGYATKYTKSGIEADVYRKARTPVAAARAAILKGHRKVTIPDRAYER